MQTLLCEKNMKNCSKSYNTDRLEARDNTKYFRYSTDRLATRGVFRGFFAKNPSSTARGAREAFWNRRAQALHVHALRGGVDSNDKAMQNRNSLRLI